MERIPPELLDHLVGATTDLYNIIKPLGKPTDDLFWKIEPGGPDIEEFRPARAALGRVVTAVKKGNPEMLSEQHIVRVILYRVIWDGINQTFTQSELEARAREATTKLLTYQARRDIDVPLIELEVGSEPVKLGSVTFIAVTEKDEGEAWWSRIREFAGQHADEYVKTYGRVTVPGDTDTAFDNAASTVSQTLLYLRGIGYRIDHKTVPQMGVLNDYPIWDSRPFRLHPPIESFPVEIASRMREGSGSPVRCLKIEELLSAVEPGVLARLQPILASSSPGTDTEMVLKFRSALRWIGEATKPDAVDAKFTKLTFALENLIGGEPSGEYVTTRGITATLAERAAFLVGANREERRKIDSAVNRFYRLRSSIVHGRGMAIEVDQLAEFTLLVRRVTWSLLSQLDSITTVNELHNWLLDQRYRDPSAMPS